MTRGNTKYGGSLPCVMSKPTGVVAYDSNNMYEPYGLQKVSETRMVRRHSNEDRKIARIVSGSPVPGIQVLKPLIMLILLLLLKVPSVDADVIRSPSQVTHPTEEVRNAAQEYSPTSTGSGLTENDKIALSIGFAMIGISLIAFVVIVIVASNGQRQQNRGGEGQEAKKGGAVKRDDQLEADVVAFEAKREEDVVLRCKGIEPNPVAKMAVQEDGMVKGQPANFPQVETRRAADDLDFDYEPKQLIKGVEVGEAIPDEDDNEEEDGA